MAADIRPISQKPRSVYGFILQISNMFADYESYCAICAAPLSTENCQIADPDSQTYAKVRRRALGRRLAEDSAWLYQFAADMKANTNDDESADKQTSYSNDDSGGDRQSVSEDIVADNRIATTTGETSGSPSSTDSADNDDEEESVGVWEETRSYDPRIIGANDLTWLEDISALGFDPSAPGGAKYAGTSLAICVDH